MSLDKDNRALAKDVLWGMYQEHCVQGRHHETQRATVTNLIIAVAAAVIAFVTFDKELYWIDLPMTLFLCILGIFGAAFTMKHYERFSLHMERARKYRDALDELLPPLNTLAPSSYASLDTALQSETPLKALKGAADKVHETEFPSLHRWHLRKWRLHQWWISLHMLIALVGLVMSLVAIFCPIRDTEKTQANQSLQPTAYRLRSFLALPSGGG